MMKCSIDRRKTPLFLVMLATLVCGFWGLYTQLPGIVKVFYSSLVLFSMVVFPYKRLFNNAFDRIEKVVLILLFVLGVIALLRSCFNFSPNMYAFGNKWVTLFANEYCMFLFYPPLFACLADETLCFVYLKKIILTFLIISLLYCLVGNFYLAPFMLLVVPPFFVYSVKHYKLAVVFLILAAFAGVAGGARIFVMFVMVALVAIFCSKKTLNNYFPKIVGLVLIAIPLVLFLPLLLGRTVESDFFQKILSSFAQLGLAKDGGSDTRTFLYLEMMHDLQKTSSLFWGKGAFAHYYSFFFDNLKDFQNTSMGRMTCEVPLLNMLLHGGVVYCIFYFLFIFLAIRKALAYGKNRFVRCIALLAAGWISICFVGDINGCRFYHIVFFFFLGCCFSKNILNMSDDEIKRRLGRCE